MNNEACFCNKKSRIIENYHSVINRKQSFISSWKIYDNNGKITFTQGTKIRKHTDALIIQSNYFCLINPWYKYINIKRDFLSIIKQINCKKLFEIILIECDCSTNSHQYELGFIQCPCLEQLNTYCTYCRFIFQLTEHSHTLQSNQSLLKNISQQTTLPLLSDYFNKKVYLDDHFSSQLGPYKHQRTVQIQIETKRNLASNDEHEINRIQTSSLLNTHHLTCSNEETDRSFIETKSIILFKNDPIKQYSLASNLEDYSSINSMSMSLPPFIEKKLLISSSKIFHATSSLSLQDQIEFNETKLKLLRKSKTQETQTKLYAILLPNSPFDCMKKANIEVQTSTHVTRTCQVNTLSYLIKTTENQIEIKQSLENIFTTNKIVRSLSMSRLDNKISSMKIHNKQLMHEKTYERQPNIPIIEFNNELMSMPPPLKCRNTCDNIDFDESNDLMASLSNDNTNLTLLACVQESKKQCLSISISNNEHFDTQLQTEKKQLNNSNIKHHNGNNYNTCLKWYERKISLSLTDHFKLNHTRKLSCSNSKRYFHASLTQKRRQLYNKKRIHRFLQRLNCHKKTNLSQFHFNEAYPSSHKIPIDFNNDGNNDLLTLQHNSIESITSFNQIQHEMMELNLHDIDIKCRYKANDHIIVARASKYSPACIQLQNLFNSQNTFLEELIDSQLHLTYKQDYRSICILIDDHKQSEQHRLSFLNYIYTSLLNSLKQIYENDSIQLTCMNLAFFNNSLCDLVKMQRLRLIDTGRKIFLLPSCETSLRTSNDINIAINRLSANMSYAHQIFIISFYSKQSSLSGSFLFLQLSPICSIRSKGLLTNLNSTTYSVLNLIRKLTNGQLFNHNRAKRYLLNDNALNRLLKNYLFSPKQITTVLTMKTKV